MDHKAGGQIEGVINGSTKEKNIEKQNSQPSEVAPPSYAGHTCLSSMRVTKEAAPSLSVMWALQGTSGRNRIH